MKRKGQMLDIWGTFVIVITGALIVLAMLAAYFLLRFPDNMKVSIDVEKFVNKPYIVGELLSHNQTGDRQFFEHTTEIVVTGGTEYMNSYGLQARIEDFMNRLGFEKKGEYLIVVKNNSATYVKIGEKAGQLNPGSGSVISNPDISNDAVVPLLYKKDKTHPDGILGYIHIVTEGG